MFSACGDPPDNFVSTTNTFESVATISCPTGSEPSDTSATVTCQADGTWSSSTATCDPVGKVDGRSVY